MTARHHGPRSVDIPSRERRMRTRALPGSHGNNRFVSMVAIVLGKAAK
jgi:hypothetical protein